MVLPLRLEDIPVAEHEYTVDGEHVDAVQSRVTVVVVKMSDVLMIVAQGGLVGHVVGHVVGQLEVWVVVTVVVVGGKKMSIVVVVVVVVVVVEVRVLKISDVLMTVAQGGLVGHVVGQLEVWVVVTVAVVGGKNISNVVVEVKVLKISEILVLVTVAHIGVVGHETGQLLLCVVVTVVGEHEVGNANVGHECGLEREPE